MAPRCVLLVMILMAALATACGGAPEKAYIPATSPLTPFEAPDDGAAASDGDDYGFTLDEDAVDQAPSSAPEPAAAPAPAGEKTAPGDSKAAPAKASDGH